MARYACLSLLVALSTIACSSDGSNSGSDGSTASGGSAASGGESTANGGASTAMGGAAQGGAVTATGGAITATGGAATAGANSASGGAPGGGAASGGTISSSGGAANGAGGSKAQGGSATASGGSAVGGSGTAGSSGSADAKMNFFVSSDTDTDANLGGLAGADERCQKLAAAAGHGNKTWRAYLSASSPMTNAKDRIGEGPYYNSKGELLAADKAALHARAGDAALFIDEKGNRINGQWQGSPTPNQHDILTGTQADGTLASGLTCGDWTATSGMSQVGHSDGLGPNMSTSGTYTVWNSAHTGQCGNTAPGGGAGRIYCFVGP